MRCPRAHSKYDSYSRHYLAVTQETARMGKHKEFELQLERWRRGMKYVEDRRAAYDLWVKQQSVNQQLVRGLEWRHSWWLVRGHGGEVQAFCEPEACSSFRPHLTCAVLVLWMTR